MSTTAPIKKRIKKLKKDYDRLKEGKESLLVLIDEAEIAENVYNSNAIENSTLSLRETEKILLEMEVSRNLSLREVFEAKNLAKVTEYTRGKVADTELSADLVLLLHRMLLNGIDDDIAGRFRQKGEYVRVGTHIAPPPEKVAELIGQVFWDYSSDLESFFTDKIARFHLDFETVHPFCDGNGRMGRVVVNYQLTRMGFPPVIIRNKEKQDYYAAFREYGERGRANGMEKIVALAVTESLHKRLAYLRGDKIVALADYAREARKTAPSVTNAARRQNIPAFREKGVWKIGV